MTITKDMSIMEVVQKYPDTVEVFMNSGMGCLGCAAAHFENGGLECRRSAGINIACCHFHRLCCQ